MVFQCSPSFPPALPGALKVFATAWLPNQKCSTQPLFLGKIYDFWAKLKQNKGWAVPTPTPLLLCLCHVIRALHRKQLCKNSVTLIFEVLCMRRKKGHSEDGDEEETVVSLGSGSTACGTLISSPCLCTQHKGPSEGTTMKSLLPHPFRLHMPALLLPLSKLWECKTSNPSLSMDVVSQAPHYREEMQFGHIFNLSGLVWHLPSSKPQHELCSLRLSAPEHPTGFSTFIKRSSSHVVEAQSCVHIIYVLQKGEEVLHLLKSQPLGQRKDTHMVMGHRSWTLLEMTQWLTGPKLQPEVQNSSAHSKLSLGTWGCLGCDLYFCSPPGPTSPTKGRDWKPFPGEQTSDAGDHCKQVNW